MPDEMRAGMSDKNPKIVPDTRLHIWSNKCLDQVSDTKSEFMSDARDYAKCQIQSQNLCQMRSKMFFPCRVCA